MKVFDYALEMEGSIQYSLNQAQRDAVPEISELLACLIKYQNDFIALLSLATEKVSDLSPFPAVKPETMLNDAQYREIMKQITDRCAELTSDIAVIWSAYSLFERSWQFYQQASYHSVQPAARILFSSLAESKNIVRLRLDHTMRILYNEVWGRVGFAPFVLGKE
jgi:hypothetical protein